MAVDGDHWPRHRPAFAVFTLVVQNNVPVRDLGTGTSSLTLFQQVGGTVGLAITGTIFTETLLKEVPEQLTAAGVPPQFAEGFASGGGNTLNQLTGVGDLGAGSWPRCRRRSGPRSSR